MLCDVLPGVTTTLTTLGADDIDTNLEAFGDVLWVADHVHVQNTMLVEPVNNFLWWYTDGRDKELSTRVNDYVDEFTQFALSVVVTGVHGVSYGRKLVLVFLLTLFSWHFLRPVVAASRRQMERSYPSKSS